MEFEVDASSRISKLKIISQIDVKLFYNKRKLLIIINTCAQKCVGGKIEKIENANASSNIGNEGLGGKASGQDQGMIGIFCSLKERYSR